MTKTTNKGKIVYLLSMMVMVFVILGYLSVSQIKKSEITRITDELIENIHTTSLDLFKNDVDFFHRELDKSAFFQTGESPYLNQHRDLVNQLHALIEEATHKENINIDNDLLEIDSLALLYHKAFEVLTGKLNERGFHESGLAGKLKESALALEKAKLIGREEWLTLRLAEKNYMLQGDPAALVEFQKQTDQLKKKYQSNPSIQVLNYYIDTFKDYVTVSNNIGFADQTGLKMELNERTDALLEAIGSLSEKAEEFTIRSYSHGLTMFLVSIIAGIAFCFVLIILIASKL